jgi:hypothetical protein
MSKRFITMAVVMILATIFLAACGAKATPAPATESPMSNGAGMDMGDAPTIPAGKAYANGHEIRFIHTEVSDQDVAKLLSDMMSSQVIYVPSLAEATTTAPVYVFKNGVKGMGPLGFQPDIFDDLPGTETYTPLRKIVFVTWTDESKARELKSADELFDAHSNGELTLEQSDVVVNMPFVAWPGGSR